MIDARERHTEPPRHPNRRDIGWLIAALIIGCLMLGMFAWQPIP